MDSGHGAMCALLRGMPSAAILDAYAIQFFDGHAFHFLLAPLACWARPISILELAAAHLRLAGGCNVRALYT